MVDLRHCWDSELLAGAATLVGSHREITARLVLYLGEIEERRLHLLAGFPSMFAFCVEELRLSEGEAFRRIVAARLVRRFPEVHELIASGDVHLSALELLSRHLTDENHRELLEAVSGKSKREVEKLLAARFPRTGPRDRILPLSPETCRIEFTASAELREKLELCRDLLSHAVPSRDLGPVIERGVELLLAKLERERFGNSAPARRRGTPTRKSNARVSKTMRMAERIQRNETDPGAAESLPSRTTSSRTLPGQEPTAESEASSTVLEARCERLMGRGLRRQTFGRDGLACTYVSPSGRRCGARAFLELDHETPRACGGRHELENLRVFCRAHNQLSAEQIFGREHVEHERHLRQRKWCKPSGVGGNDLLEADASERRSALPGSDAQIEQPTVRSETLAKVRLALTTMGFRDAEARRAIQRAAASLPEHLTVEQALRAALMVTGEK